MEIALVHGDRDADLKSSRSSSDYRVPRKETKELVAFQRIVPFLREKKDFVCASNRRRVDIVDAIHVLVNFYLSFVCIEEKVETVFGELIRRSVGFDKALEAYLNVPVCDGSPP